MVLKPKEDNTPISRDRNVRLSLLVDENIPRIIAVTMKELNLPNQRAALDRIVNDWWFGRSTPLGHNSIPTAEEAA